MQTKHRIEMEEKMSRLFSAAGLVIASLLPAPAMAAPLDLGEGSGLHAVRYVVSAGGAVGSGGGGAAPKACSDSTYELDDGPFVVEGTFEHYFISGSTPAGLSVTNTETAVKESVTNWTKARNDCGLADDLDIAVSYEGRVSGAVEITDSGACQDASDGRSETGFGTLPSGVLGVACVWLAGWKPPYRVESADVRLNKAKGWWNTISTCKGSRYVVEAALTHERGHIFGLTHGKTVTEGGHANLTMSPSINSFCADAETTLGKGDVLGMRALGY
jgi:hypothetical protein